MSARLFSTEEDLISAIYKDYQDVKKHGRRPPDDFEEFLLSWRAPSVWELEPDSNIKGMKLLSRKVKFFFDLAEKYNIKLN